MNETWLHGSMCSAVNVCSPTRMQRQTRMKAVPVAVFLRGICNKRENICQVTHDSHETCTSTTHGGWYETAFPCSFSFLSPALGRAVRPHWQLNGSGAVLQRCSFALHVCAPKGGMGGTGLRYSFEKVRSLAHGGWGIFLGSSTSSHSTFSSLASQWSCNEFLPSTMKNAIKKDDEWRGTTSAYQTRVSRIPILGRRARKTLDKHSKGFYSQ